MRAWVLPIGIALSATAAECTKHEQTQLEHGADLYARMCVVCHGPTGEGYKADNATALSHQDFLSSVSDEFLRRAIKDGRRGTVMSAWGELRGGPLMDSDVEAIISFMRSWQTKPVAILDDGPIAGNVLRGASLYSQNCARCHGTTGTEGPNVRLGNLDFQTSASNGFLRHAIKFGRPGTPMGGFEAMLGSGGIEDVLSFLRSFQNPVPAIALNPHDPTGMFPFQRELPPPPSPPPPLTLGPVPLNPRGPDPEGFGMFPNAKTGVDVVHAQLARGAKMAILDARAPTDYTFEHITGAVSVPFYDPDPYVPKLPKDAWIVCYCSCPSAESGSLCQKLSDKGFKKLTVLEEGIGVWKARKYPVSQGPKP